MIGSVVVLYNPTQNEISNINTYIQDVDYAVIVDNSNANNKSLIFSLLYNVNKIEYYSEGKNLGLCKGLNIGVEILKEKGCNWALLFDADSRLGSDIISVYKKAIKEHKEKKIAVYTPVHIFDRSNKRPYKGYKNVSWSMTSGWLIDIDLFKKQNGFFEELFVDGLDMDYCFRTHENGYEIVECGEAVINHNPAKTKRFMGIKYGIASPYRYYMQSRQLVWCWKRYKKSQLFFLYLYKWFKVLFLFPDKLEYIRNMINGTKAGFCLYKGFKRGIYGKSIAC